MFKEKLPRNSQYSEITSIYNTLEKTKKNFKITMTLQVSIVSILFILAILINIYY